MAVTQDRASWWSITINNPTDDDRQRLNNRPTWVKMLKYQEEVGEEGTPHIQAALQSAQTRLSTVKGWLPRAHIEPARDKNALLKYVAKTETAVPGSQVEIKTEYLSMDKVLLEIAKRSKDIASLVMGSSTTQKVLDDWKREEYWEAVNEIVLEKPSTIGLFTNPQLERAWIKTRETWILILDRQDRQTEVEEA